MINFSSNKLFQIQLLTLCMCLLGVSTLMAYSKIEASEIPGISFYNDINLIKNINNEYAKSIKLISKSLTITIKRNQQPRAKKLPYVKKQTSQKTITYVYTCQDSNTSIPLRNEIRKMGNCYDVATDVASKTSPSNVVSDDLDLGLNPLKVISKNSDLDLNPINIQSNTSFALGREDLLNEIFFKRRESIQKK